MSERHAGFKAAMQPLENLVVVEFPFEGRTATAIIDTGANVLVVDPAVEVKRTFVRKTKHGGGTSKRKSGDIVEIPFPCFSTLKTTPTEALEAPLGHLSDCVGRTIDFVIGYPVLRKMVLTFDYPNRFVYFAEACGDVPNSSWIIADFDGRNIHVPLVVQGKTVERLLVDTGAGTCLLEPDIITELELLKIHDKVAIALDCLGEQRERPFFRADNVEFAGRTFKDVEFMESDHTGGSRNGIVGTNLLDSFEVVIDYPRKRFALL